MNAKAAVTGRKADIGYVIVCDAPEGCEYQLLDTDVSARNAYKETRIESRRESKLPLSATRVHIPCRQSPEAHR